MTVDAPPPGEFGEAEHRRCLHAAASSPYPCRDRALLQLFWYFGPTVRQVTALEPADLDLAAGRLTWPGGTQAQLPADLVRTLAAYLRLERDPRCPKLFGGRHRRPLDAARLDRMFRRLAAASGVPVNPWALRRSALTRLLRTEPLRTLGLVRGSRRAVAQPASQQAGR